VKAFELIETVIPDWVPPDPVKVNVLFPRCTVTEPTVTGVSSRR
jgi:hypothetical protein